MVDILIFVPVGTSLMTNLDTLESVKQAIGAGCIEEVKERWIDTLNQKSDQLERYYGNPDRKMFSAEISSIYAFWRDNEHAYRNNTVHLILLHAPDDIGKMCANVLKTFFNNDSQIGFQAKSSELFQIKGLNPENASSFPSALDKLADKITDEINEFRGDEIYINISGGYKALGPYLSMMAMATNRQVGVFYLFEKSTKILHLPSYPLAFDMAQWRDWRGMLLPFTEKGLLADYQLDDFYKVIRETKVAGLLKQQKKGGEYELNSVGLILQNNYKNNKLRLTEFGQGHLLLSGLVKQNQEKLAEYLKNECIPRWQYLATGDHIPETVEHGRGHVQRILELARQLLHAIKCPANEGTPIHLVPDQLFVLICSIWLHDLGHSGNEFTFEGTTGFVQNGDDPESEEVCFVATNPDWVRKYHNLLSWELIKTEQEFLFPTLAETIEDDKRRNRIIRSIQYACLYHRRKMPVNKNTDEVFIKKPYKVRIKRCIEDFKEGEEVINGFPLVVGLLRVLDGAENQQERAGSENSYKVTDWVLKRQIKSMKRYLDNPSCEYRARIQAEHDFKDSAPPHYEKHRLVKNILIVPEKEHTDININCIYGTEDNNLPIPLVGVYIIANPDTCKNEKDEKQAMEDIVYGFLDEFMRVKDLLNFRIVLYFVPNIETEPKNKKQICFPNFNVHQKEYELF